MSSNPPTSEPRPQSSMVMPAESDPAGKPYKPAPIWLQRLSLLVQVMFCVYLGILLVILPWWPHLLENNELILAYPVLHTVLSFGAVRGILSGIGLVDIWIGISEVIDYREIRG